MAGILLVLAFTILVFVEDHTVYITKTGEGYYVETCSSLRVTKIPVKLSEAVRRGLTPCRIFPSPSQAQRYYACDHAKNLRIGKLVSEASQK